MHVCMHACTHLLVFSPLQVTHSKEKLVTLGDTMEGLPDIVFFINTRKPVVAMSSSLKDMILL